MSFAQTLEVMAPRPLTEVKVVSFDDILYLGRAQARTQRQARSQAYPFLKWAGGKRALVPAIMKLLPARFNDYYEPFLGGGAVFFGIGSRRNQHSYLSDVNEDLMLCWRMIQTRAEDVIKQLEHHKTNHCKRHYLDVRDMDVRAADNSTDSSIDPVDWAARFIYLNKTCFNGLYRVNKKGRFNVSMGNYKNPLICDADNLRAVSAVLQTTSLSCSGFEKLSPYSGDLVYCDPPYDGTYNSYNANGFTDADQKRLRDCANIWSARGAHVIVSNSDTPLIRRLWAEWTLAEVDAPRNISCTAAGRGKIGELLIHNT